MAVEAQTIASGGARNSTPGTLNRMFFDAVERYDMPDALRFKRNGQYEPISHKTLAERVRRVALGLSDLGIKPGDRVAILSENRPEWAIADLACITAGLTDVPIYPTLPPDQIAYVLEDSGSVAIFCSTEEQSAKVASIRAQVPALKTIIGLGDTKFAGEDMLFSDVESKGKALDTPDRREQYMKTALAVKPDDILTLIYTSGTTGQPKGVMITHDNIYSNVMASADVIPFAGKDRCLSFLPLCHIFERMSGHYLMLHTGTSISYAESNDLVPKNMLEVHPTLMFSVPRLYEKMYARVLENASSGGALKKRIFTWASSVASRWADEKLAGLEPSGGLALQYRIAQKLVFSKLKARTGGELRYFVSGGAPLSPEINKFFYAAGLIILEGYGLTETSPVICVNSPAHFRIGTVGQPIPSVEVMIAGDGEILTRGPHVMKGYFNKPEATAEAIDKDGWFHTGDIGVLEDDYLRITDRKKDLIVTAGGKNIAPQPIENKARTNQFVAEAVMIGDKRKFPSMLVVPDWGVLDKWAAENGVSAASHAEMLKLPAVHKKMEDEVFGSLSALAHYEMPRKIALLENEFSVDRGELTATLKVKRRVVDKNYKDVIDAMYVEHEG